MRPVRTLKRTSALVALGFLLATTAPAQQPAGGTATDGPGPYLGRSLSEALLDLQQQGLRIVFTTRTVRPSMRVEIEPTAEDPRRVLDELLQPHGLTARDGPNGSVVVVPSTPEDLHHPFVVEGIVRTRVGGRPLADVLIEVTETENKATSGADGSFRLQLPDAGSFSLDVRLRGFVIEHLERVAVVAESPTELEVLLDAAPVTEERVVVTPSRVSLMREQPARPLALSRDDILALPHLGDDFFRALSLLPGVSANDVSAEFHVRGARSDETQVLLDGQELYEAFHLKDFDNALSVVAATTLDSVDLSTGGFPVEHGDRMAGVLDMSTRNPGHPHKTQIGLSPLNLDVGSTGIFANGRGGWLTQARRGAIDLASKLIGPERPQYWDAFGKLDYQATKGQGLRLNLLHSADELELDQTSVDGFKYRETSYQSSYLWLTHQMLVGGDLLIESAISRSRVDRDRRGLEIEDDVQFDITDKRELRVAGLRQEWDWLASKRHSLKWGFELRNFEAEYDYRGAYAFDNPLAAIRTNGEASSTHFVERFDANHNSVYVSDRVRVGDDIALEIGLRHDDHSLTDENLLSPRLNLALDIGERSVLRASWGRFTQSQRPYELQVEDGETQFNDVERSEHYVLGFEHAFGIEGGSGTTLRIEAYRRAVANPLSRYENLYEPINTFPEVEPDRVRIIPVDSQAQGVELFLRGRERRFGWWVNYTYSTSEDDLGDLTTFRRFDQTHALNLDADLQLGEKWHLNLAWRFHTGWPTTPLSLEETVISEINEDGEIEAETVFLPVLGSPFSARLPDYHRLDIRASRRWRARTAAFTFFIDIQNAYDRRNVSGFDFEIDEDEGTLVSNPENWAQILPSLGIRIEF